MSPTNDTPMTPLPNSEEGGAVNVTPSAGTPTTPLPEMEESGPAAPGGRVNHIPITPLPNPGEGGPVSPGPGNNTPVIPLPNPGEGGPVSPGPGNNTPVIPLPNPGEGGPVSPGPGNNTPVIPLPNPGEGGPVYPGDIVNPSVPVIPCTGCGQVRFLNAALGYRPFRIALNNRQYVSNLSLGSITNYQNIANGFHTVTVMGPNGYIYLQKALPFRGSEQVTVAIINTASGLDLLQISDTGCNRPRNQACYRVCNLAYYSNPLDVMLSDGRVVYSDVRMKEVTAFKRMQPGEYQFYLTETPIIQPREMEALMNLPSTLELPEVLVSYYVMAQPNMNYTSYFLNYEEDPRAIQVLTVENR